MQTETARGGSTPAPSPMHATRSWGRGISSPRRCAKSAPVDVAARRRAYVWAYTAGERAPCTCSDTGSRYRKPVQEADTGSRYRKPVQAAGTGSRYRPRPMLGSRRSHGRTDAAVQGSPALAAAPLGGGLNGVRRPNAATDAYRTRAPQCTVHGLRRALLPYGHPPALRRP